MPKNKSVHVFKKAFKNSAKKKNPKENRWKKKNKIQFDFAPFKREPEEKK